MDIGIIGAGVMGAGIAQTLATAGHSVTCQDISDSAIERAREAIVDGRFGLRAGVERARLTEADADSALDRLRFTTILVDAAQSADLVIDATPEDIALKVRLFAALDRSTPEGCILASNSSGLPIAAMAAATQRPDRVIGWHWASPAVAMKMAEIVVTDRTSESTVRTVTDLARACGKRPVVVRENVQVWGFAANRVMAALLREARLVVQEGVATEEGLDQLLVDGWGWPVGPFTMLNGAVDGWGDGRESSIRHTQRV